MTRARPRFTLPPRGLIESESAGILGLGMTEYTRLLPRLETEPLTFTIPGAARRIGCGEKKVRAEVKAGRLPTVLVGDQTRILYSDIHKYLADRRRTACPSTDAKARRSGGTISPSTVVGFEEARRLRPARTRF